MKIVLSVLLLAGMLAFAACAPEERAGDQAAAGRAARQTQMPMGEMPRMAGMAGTQSDSTMQRMLAHMEAMMGADADSTRSIMPMHRQMAANMLAQMNREMQQMNMEGDEAWTATVDSLRQDLTRMPEMSPAEMQALMPAHHSRLNRLMEMHRSMMGNMRM